MNICEREFQRGQLTRRYGSKLVGGTFQLQQTRSLLLDKLGQIEELRRFVLINLYTLRPKVPRMARGAMKCMPELIAYELGWAVLPAIAALSDEGVPPSVVELIESDAARRAEAFVRCCSSLQRSFHSGMRIEINCLRYGESGLETLLNDILSFISDLLGKCAPYLENELAMGGQGAKTASDFQPSFD